MSRIARAANLFLISGLALACSPHPGVAQTFNGGPTVVGTKIADGQAYATVVVLEHQPNPADNGRILLAFEASGWDGIPIYESTDDGSSWRFVANAQDSVGVDTSRCNMHWQPHLTEMPRTEHGIEAGTVLLSASTVCQRPPPERGNEGMYLRLFTSNDFGRSWDYVSTYAEASGENPIWEPNLQILDDGTFVEFYSDETHKAEGYNQLLGHEVSHDGGKTWGPLILDTAMKGGVERPGMVIIDRLPDGRYVYNFEDVAGPVSGQVYLKFSDDGLDWGDPEDRGTPVESMSGQYANGTPNVFWFPINGPKGVLAVTSRRKNGPAADNAGNTLFWNSNLGVGPWWTAPTPVQKIGSGRAGWTQALILQSDGRLLHITSSGSPDGGGSEILFNAAAVNFNRYEAESAGQQGTAVMGDRSMSLGAKARLGANDVGKLTFEIYVPKAGAYNLGVEYTDIGFEATPRLTVNGRAVTGSVAPVEIDPELAAQRERGLGTRSSGEHRILSAVANLQEGENTIEIGGGEYALDLDYREVTPAAL
jgi:hypothetical protein